MPPGRPEHLPPALPWWPTNSGTDVGIGDASGTEDTPYYLASTDLPGGRLGVIVDTGAWTNLWGLRFAMRLAHKAKQAALQPTEERLRTPLYVAGVGSGSQQANWELNIPIATTNRDGTTTQHSMLAPAVEGEGSELPALLGLRSMQASSGVVETGVKQKRLTYPGPGGYEITWAPGAVHFDLESAPSGHLLIPVDNYDKLAPAAGGLQQRQLSLLAVGNAGGDCSSQLDREFGKLKVKVLSPYAKLPKRASAGAAGYDIYATHDYDITARSRRAIATGIAALASPGTYIRVAPRSGLALKDVDVAAGVIDPDYRGEIKAVLVNHGAGIFQVKRGMAIAQLILERHVIDEVVQVDELPDTTRGSSGFGSTDLSYLSTIYEDEEYELDTTGVGISGAGADSEVPPH